MTYRELVEYIEARVNAHPLVNQYGFGNLSDIETPDGASPEYPYVFLRPVSMQIAQHNNQFDFELILMDYVFDTTYSYVDGVSRMTQILADIVEDLRSNQNRDLDITLNVTATPFKERFKDSVVGITATLNIVTAQPLDGCSDILPSDEETPVEPTPGVLRVHATASQDYLIDPETGGISPTLSQVFWFDNIIETDGNWENYIRYNVPEAGTYKFVVDGQITLTQPDENPEAVSGPPKLLQIADGVATYIEAEVATGWPTVFQSTETVYDVHLEWTVDAPLTTYTYEYVRGNNSNQFYDLEYYEKAGTSIKIYKV